MSNSEVPEYMRPIYQIYLSEKNKDSFVDICDNWTFSDMMISFQAMQDESFITQIIMDSK